MVLREGIPMPFGQLGHDASAPFFGMSSTAVAGPANGLTSTPAAKIIAVNHFT
jgi:hypothetical protein